MDNVLPMVEPAPGKQDRIVARVVRTGIAQVTTEDRCGIIEQGPALFLLGLHLAKEIPEATHNATLNFLQLVNALRVTPVMGEVVMLAVHAVDPEGVKSASGSLVELELHSAGPDQLVEICVTDYCLELS